ncbi:hypothetical protein D3C86_1582180 [compost metagenome]
MGTVIRHERMLDHQALAAGTGQAEGVPIVFNDPCGAGHQHRHAIDHLTAGITPQAAEKRPFAVIATAGSFPRAADVEATLDLFDLAEWRVGRGGDHGIVLTPGIQACLLWQRTVFPLVDTQNHHVPGAAAAATPQLHQDFVEHRGRHLPAAVFLGLEDLEETGVDERLYGLAGHHPVLFH